MDFIPQRAQWDCGIAALAMLCDVTYEKADLVIHGYWGDDLRSTSTKQLRLGALRLGYITQSTPRHRLKKISPPKSWKKLAFRTVADLWYLIPDNSLIKMSTPATRTYGWHWVVWSDGMIYDPAIGMIHPSHYPHTPSSYMQFIETGDPCPKCGKQLDAKWSGVSCPSCKYTFCY